MLLFTITCQSRMSRADRLIQRAAKRKKIHAYVEFNLKFTNHSFESRRKGLDFSLIYVYTYIHISLCQLLDSKSLIKITWENYFLPLFLPQNLSALTSLKREPYWGYPETSSKEKKGHKINKLKNLVFWTLPFIFNLL